jgi:hypothetical protein
MRREKKIIKTFMYPNLHITKSKLEEENITQIYYHSHISLSTPLLGGKSLL